MTPEEFETKVKAMTAKEIIMSMVEGLRNPACSVDMSTFGDVDDGVCVGCAATNAVALIGGISELTPTDLLYGNLYSDSFVGQFEDAIDSLRSGSIKGYNHTADLFGISLIRDLDINLPCLSDDYTEEELLQYVALADAQGE